MDVIKGGSRPTRVAPKEYFTGPVFQDPIIEAAEPSRQRATYVTFGPGGRTGWHTHPLGQTLYIVSGAEPAWRKVEDIIKSFSPAGVAYVGEGELARICKIAHNVMLGVVT